MKANPYITNKELAEVCGITEDGVYQNTQKLKKNNRIRRIGGDKGGYWEVIENGTEQQQHTESGVKGGVKEPNVTKDVTKELTERQSVILEMITEDSFVTIPEMSLKTGVATRTIKRDIENLQSSGILTRKGGRKDGEWIVTELGMAMLEALKK